MGGHAAVSERAREDGLRFGLCCQFLDAPIRFRTATHRYVSRLEPNVARRHLATIAADNAAALHFAVERCHGLGIGAFRITSGILPLGTHPESGYSVAGLDRHGTIRESYRAAAVRACELDVRLSFHPDQFVVLGSEREAVVAASVAELDFQAEIAELVGADVMVVHGGGTAGGMTRALERLSRGIERLNGRARSRLALENDDRHFAPIDLLPLCEALGVPLVYDVHHHRCHPDGLSTAEATARAAATWGEREPFTHISSPRDGWEAPDPKPHADYVDPTDFPEVWRGRRMTVDVEAKAKERAVLRLKAAVGQTTTLISRFGT
jgi:UV DNA damage endonuclease